MPTLIGIWMYASLIYNGVPVARPNPDLHMYIAFPNSEENELYYYDKTAGTDCRRAASYKTSDRILYQKVKSVNNNNSSSCSSDTDMQINNESYTEVSVEGDKLFMIIPLGDESITYVWTRAEL